MNPSTDPITILLQALELIAAAPRPDGTYNRCREACEQLAKKAIKDFWEQVDKNKQDDGYIPLR